MKQAQLSLFEQAVQRQRVTRARNTDPETAQVAAEDNHEARGKQRLDVLKFLRSRGVLGATDFETSEALGILRTSAGKRRKELCEMNLVEDTGLRRETDTRSTAMVWRAKA